MTTRLEVNVDNLCARWIEEARVHGVSPTEHVRRALSVYQYVNARMADGDRIIVEHTDGKRDEMRILNADVIERPTW